MNLALGRPTDEELREHNTTDTPAMPWCPYCTVAIGMRDTHSRMRKEVQDIEVSLDKVPTLSVEYTCMIEK